jgi:hypothetical protein
MSGSSGRIGEPGIAGWIDYIDSFDPVYFSAICAFYPVSCRFIFLEFLAIDNDN